MKSNLVKIIHQGIEWTVEKRFASLVPTFSSPPKDLPSVSGGRHPHKILSVPGSKTRLVIKQARRGGMLAKANKNIFFSPARAKREFELAACAVNEGVPVAHIVAFGIRKLMPGAYHIFSVSELIEDAQPLPVFLRTFKGRQPRKVDAILAAASAVGKLHDAGISHCDLNANNILIRHKGRMFEAFIIDLDKSTRCRKLSRAERLRNLARLDRSLRKLKLRGAFVSRTDAARFAAACIKDGPTQLRKTLRDSCE